MVLSVDRNVYQVPANHAGWHFLCYLISLAFITNISVAGQLDSLSITEVDGEYKVRLVALLDAPVKYVYTAITDYKHIYRVNPSIIESEILSVHDDGTIRVRNRFEHCIAVFCFEVDMVEDLVEVGDGLLIATTVPALSSFELGTTVWHVRSFGKGRAQVLYRTNIKPDFFIPPIIGSVIIKSVLRKEIIASFSIIECYAKIMAKNGAKDAPVRTAEHAEVNNDCAG